MACCPRCPLGARHCPTREIEMPLPVNEFSAIDRIIGEERGEAGESYFAPSARGSNGKATNLLEASVELQVQDASVPEMAELKIT